MLLVKSSVLKNSDRKSYFKSLAYLSFASVFWGPAQALAAESAGPGAASILSIFMSLLVVIAVVFMLAWLMRRFNVTQTGSGQIKVVASMMTGPKERIMVVQVGDEQHLIGITSQQINHLATLKTPLIAETGTGPEKFKEKLAMLMAGKLPANSRDQGHKHD